MEYECFLTDSLEKVFPGARPRALGEGRVLPVFGGEIPAFQLVYTRRKEAARSAAYPLNVKVNGAPARLRSVELVPADFPAYETAGEGYLSTEPGLFPDLLAPLEGSPLEGSPLEGNRIYPVPGQYRALWIDFPDLAGVAPGTYPLCITVSGESMSAFPDGFIDCNPPTAGFRCELQAALRVLPLELPAQQLIHTQWFHTDCLASYYQVEPLSEAHWDLIDAFMAPMAPAYGINTVLTPVFTPPLDTALGAERPTVQLVEVARCALRGGGGYRFGFAQLERWCGLCKKHGILNLEIAHLFTQWGARFTPKIVAAVEGVKKRIFGWDVPAASPEYRRFLTALIPALRQKLRDCGYDDDHVFFHISDEPSESCLAEYRAAREQAADLLPGSMIVDALSDMAFYKHGLVEHPIAANDRIAAFIEAGVPKLWTYYCSAQCRKVPNRFFALPSPRNRVMGLLMYLHNIAGFLHWGYNFYYAAYSRGLIDPYYDTGASRSFPAGDAFLVYPGADGKPLSSIRGEVLRQGIDDMRVLALVEERCGRAAAEKIARQDFPGDLNFEQYPGDPEHFFRLRELAAAALLGG
jgi:hypothetical protein